MAERIELVCPLSLFVNMTGMKQIGIPAVFRIEQAAPKKEQPKKEQREQRKNDSATHEGMLEKSPNRVKVHFARYPP